MSRRSPSTLSLAVVAACALLLTACGEQTPGGIPDDGHQVEQVSGQEGQGGLDGQGGQDVSGDQAQPSDHAEAGGGDEQDEQNPQFAGSDADDPIVVKIGEDEYATNMAIYRRYDEAKGGPLALRSPIAPAEDLGGGEKQEYVAGTIFWHPDTGAQIVRGQILVTYLDNGGPTGQLGWPVGDETVEDEVIYSDFQHGQIRLEDQSIRIVEDEAEG